MSVSSGLRVDQASLDDETAERVAYEDERPLESFLQLLDVSLVLMYRTLRQM